uniref:DDE-type integrase/transposase/recombinase n=1 Tax=Sphingomonas nostoxanthinifaciens TaxID=2872652 RepID=UPI001CC1FBD5|nr:DDE-type integrase/transposase/recombinase [Sphingomonas nostoxanthinifaciens]
MQAVALSNEQLVLQHGAQTCERIGQGGLGSRGRDPRKLRYQRTRRGRSASLHEEALKRHGAPEAVTTDGLRSYRAAMTELGNEDKQEVGRWANNRVENSHLPFRRRERAILRFRRMARLQKFASVHANVHNHFNLERHLVDRQTYKLRRLAALAEWQILMS